VLQERTRNIQFTTAPTLPDITNTYLYKMTNANLKESFGTLSETVNGLIKSGYTLDFNIQGECIVCQQAQISLSPEEFQIDKVYRFEGASDPDDQAIVYAISSSKFGVKGTLVNGYGVTAANMPSVLVEKLQTHNLPVIVKKKFNDATPQRPEGNRLLDAYLVEMNLPQLIEQIKEETTWEKSSHNSVTIFKSDTMRIVLIGLHENAEIKPHTANGVISVQVLEGKIKFVTEQQTSVVEKGQMLALHKNITHSVLALAESFFLLTLAVNK
jgi:quercetin dioxygenase-like cupin family protein